ncbi:unnamed protein product, partial [marine sediment metagenome]
QNIYPYGRSDHTNLTQQYKLYTKPEKVKLAHYLWEAIIALKDVWPFFFIIVVIIGSIYSGVMTPTEAAAVSCFLAIILGSIIGK